MKVNIIKRLEALEKQILVPEAVPALIMIHYDSFRQCWIAGEHYGNRDTDRLKEVTFDRLSDYCFWESFKGRVILDTFESPELETDIFQNLFCFDIDDLRADLKEPADLYISKIKSPEDDHECEFIIQGRKEE